LSKRLSEKDKLSVGLGLGITMLGFDYDELRFNSQFNGELFTPDLASGEIAANANDNVVYADMNVGVNWSHRVKKSRSFLNVGIAALHFNAPKVNFYTNEKENLDARLNLFINGAVQINRRFDVRGRTLVQRKGSEKEFIVGLAGRLYLDPHLSKETAIEIGLNHRFFDFGDAWSPTLEFHHKSMTVGFSYDINVSDFNVATQNRGGFELALIYRTARIPDLKPKDCKLF